MMWSVCSSCKQRPVQCAKTKYPTMQLETHCNYLIPCLSGKFAHLLCFFSNFHGRLILMEEDRISTKDPWNTAHNWLAYHWVNGVFDALHWCPHMAHRLKSVHFTTLVSSACYVHEENLSHSQFPSIQPRPHPRRCLVRRWRLLVRLFGNGRNLKTPSVTHILYVGHWWCFTSWVKMRKVVDPPKTTQEDC